MRTCHTTRRRAVSLVEMMAAMAVASLVLGLATVLLVMLLRFERGGRQHVQRTRELAALARQFRADVHRAERHEPLPEGDGPLLRLVLPDEAVVEYHRRGEELLRHELQAGTRRRKEAFDLPAPFRASVAFSEDTSASIVSLLIADGADPNGVPSGRVFRVDAALSGPDRASEEN